MLARLGKVFDPRIEFLRAVLQYKLTWRRDALIAVADKYADDPEALGPIHEELVEALSEAELPQRALELLKKNSAGGPYPSARAVLEARIRYLQLGEVAHAMRLLDELITSPPGAVPPARRLAAAELLANVGEAERAWAALEIADVPTGLRMRRLVLSTRLLLREPEDAAADRREAVRLLTDARAAGVEEKLDLAEALLEIPDPARALALATSVTSHRGRFRAAVVETRILIPRNEIAAADDRLYELAHFPARTPAETATLVGLELARRRTPAARTLAGTLPDWWVLTHEGRKLRMNFILLADDRATATKLSAQMSKERPTDADVEGLRAQALVADRAFKNALTAYDRLLERRPQDEGFRIGRAQVLRKINRARDAYAAMRALAQEYRARGEPVPASLELVIAGVVEDLHDYLRVRATMEWALELFPGDPEILKGLARAHARMDKPKLALELFEEAQAAEDQPKPVENLQTISGYLRSLGSRGEAVHALEHALEIEPGNPDALTAMAGLMSERDKTRKRGLALYKAAVDRDPANPDLRAARASALIAAGRHRQADRELDRVHSSRPRHPGAQRVRADLELAHGRTLAAERALVRLKKEAGPDPSVDIGLSRVAEARGKGYLTERVVHALRAFNEAPRREEVHQRLDQVVRTRYSVRNEYETDTNDLTNRFLRGELFQVMGPASEASLRTDVRMISRRGVKVEGVDLHLDGNVNPERGTSFEGTVTLGMLGDNNVDLLGAVEIGHRTPTDWSFSYRVSRARVDDSPDALLRTIRSTSHQIETERQIGPWVVSAFHRVEHLNDGNERQTTSPRLGYRFHPRLAASLEYLHQSADFQPDPIDLYFAPLSYDLTILDVDWTLKSASAWTVTLGGGPRREEQAGQGANGVQGRFRASYRFRQELEAFIGGNVQYSEGNRRLAVVEPYTLTGVQVGVNGRF
jgi:tetratricopeptide (TPR) repeat protein